MPIDSNLGIWENESCFQCGACCYEINQSFDKKSCDNQEIRSGKSYCLIHDEKDRRWGELCSGFFCGNLKKPSYQNPEIARKELIRISIKLGTNPN
ncbi:hypothetical protein J4429_06035 [Candidatus Pacearchaeota archaeon]|nr:hypothetical protein [Candidatus Pacearchaeota archaeon]